MTAQRPTKARTRLIGHGMAGRYVVRNLDTGLVAYFTMCDCNYESPWSSTQTRATNFYRAHRESIRATAVSDPQPKAKYMAPALKEGQE